MSTIQIKTPSPEQSLPLVKEALKMEKKLTRDSLAISEGRITALVRQLGVTVDQVLEGAVAREEENEQALLDLEGELELRRTLQDILKHSISLKYVGSRLRASRICSDILETPHVVSHSLGYEDRPPVAGIVKGSATFSDGQYSTLRDICN